MKVTFFQHVPFENPGSFIHILENYTAVTETIHWYADRPSRIDLPDMLIVMGGPMSIYDETEFPWLIEEKAFIKKAIDSGKVVIGVCLGAQMIADVLGATIYKLSEPEIGWFTVKKSGNGVLPFLPDYATVFHWHGEAFSLPEGSSLIYSSKLTENQAFVYDNRVLALQFHLEMSREGSEALCLHCADDMTAGDYVMNAGRIQREFSKHEAGNQRILKNLVHWLLDVNSL